MALEVEGAIFKGRAGRHTSPVGYTDDCVKYNEAVAHGWKLVRVTSMMRPSGLHICQLAAVLAEVPDLVNFCEFREIALENVGKMKMKTGRRKTSEKSPNKPKTKGASRGRSKRTGV